MIDHTGITVTDFERSKLFYSRALSAIGFQLLMEVPKSVTGNADAAGFGAPPKPEFWISAGMASANKVHIAFRVDDRAQVDAFHRAALAAGGRDNGAPGLRPHYHAHYYGAFILDPDGYNIEAVCHTA